ncbi:MAG: transglycosylase domain-containing protein [Candidatus Wildermuthbacteria bacterium]|nr:transglycosylase domain-containing protein [Candidatus Wildermuthbacteria bacterium]
MRHPRRSQKTDFFSLKRGGVLRLFLLCSAGLFILGLGIFVYYAKDLPRPEKFTELQLSQPTRIYDRTGTVLLYEIYGEVKREVVPLNQVPGFLPQAIIATEDANFYHHFGLDWKGIARSMLKNLRLRDPSQFVGGSTISQQFVRSSLLTRKKTVERKIQEIVLTLELERRYSKEQILEFYLNQIPFGSNAYGVAAASKTYFNKTPKDLTVAEAALLAAMIQAPSYYSPYGAHKEELFSRKNYVLARMESLGFLSKESAESAKNEELVFADPSPGIKAPHFALYVTDLLVQEYGEDFLRENGLSVITSLDWDLQELAEKSVADHAKTNEAYHAYNAALVALDPNTGEILAMVGSKNWFAKESFPAGCVPPNCLFDPKVNVATRIPGRQPGSAFKPFAYVTAFMKGYDDKTKVVDELTNFGVWGDKEYIPQNYDGKFRGEVTLREALAQSLNIPSIKVLLNLAGIKDSIDIARDMGLGTIQADPSNYGPSLVLGGGEVRLLDLVSAYGVFAAQGMRIPSLPILRIENKQGEVIKETKNTPIRILPEGSASLIGDILSDNSARTPIFGSRSILYFPDRTVSVKTGTTQDFRDGWVMGYTKDIAAGVWVGNSDNSSMSKEPGIVVAGPIWRQFLDGAFKL